MEVKSRSDTPEPWPGASAGGRLRPMPASAAGMGSARTFPELIDRFVRSHGERVFLPRRRARVVEPMTFRRLCDDVAQVAAGLLSLGLERGDRIGLLAENRYEWLLADLGTTYFGGVDVPRGCDTAPAEMAFILRHSGCRAAFVEDDATAAAVLAHRADLPALQHVVTLSHATTVPSVLTLHQLMERGRSLLTADRHRLPGIAASVRPDDLLTIVYTSGTTADPKGVMLTHDNVLSNVRSVCEVLHITGEDSFLSVLPAWHMYERIMDYLALTTGAQLLYTDRRHIKEDLQQLAPTVFAAVPRIWETIHDGIVGHAHKLYGVRGRVLRATLELCRTIGGCRASWRQRLLHRLARATVLKKLLAITGGRLRLAVSGGGALPRHVDELLLGIGLPLLNGYGLTETSPVASVRLPQRNRPGTIGPPLPGTAIEVRDFECRPVPVGQTGILWIRGPQVMRGYYENPAKTREVLDAHGWFNSGDLGHVDERGEVWITGRAKDTIVLAGGENVEPEPIEAALKTSPLIQQAMCVGQDRKVLGALLVPDPELLEQHVPRSQWDLREGRLHGRAVHTLLRSEIDRLVCRDTGFRPCDRIASFHVLGEPLTIENGCMTQTLKIRRHIVQERYRDLIDALFE